MQRMGSQATSGLTKLDSTNDSATRVTPKKE